MGAITGNGSASKVLDSTAIARVEFVLLSKTGVFASRARTGANKTTQKKVKTITK